MPGMPFSRCCVCAKIFSLCLSSSLWAAVTSYSLSYSPSQVKKKNDRQNFKILVWEKKHIFVCLSPESKWYHFKNLVTKPPCSCWQARGYISFPSSFSLMCFCFESLWHAPSTPAMAKQGTSLPPRSPQFQSLHLTVPGFILSLLLGPCSFFNVAHWRNLKLYGELL